MHSGLYQRIIGNEWLSLAENIKLAHSLNQDIPGTFHISHGTNWLAKILLKRSKLPAPSNGAETRLKIVPDGAGERWERCFNQKTFTTKQWEAESGQLAERFGEWELHFTLRVEQGNLIYVQRQALLRLGNLRLPIPRVCAPFVSALETNDDILGVRVSVIVRLPILGLLISYEGHLNVKGLVQ